MEVIDTNNDDWLPIALVSTIKDGEPLLLAHFRPPDPVPIYVVMACWGTEMPGHTSCTSYSGWFVEAIPLEDPPRRRGTIYASGILSRSSLPPTHWKGLGRSPLGPSAP